MGASGPLTFFGSQASGQDDEYGNFLGPGFGNGGQSGDFRVYYTDVSDSGHYSESRGLKLYLSTHLEADRSGTTRLSFGQSCAPPIGAATLTPNLTRPIPVSRNDCP